MPAPALVRFIPAPVRRRVKAALRPYAARFFDAYFEDYLASRGGQSLHPRLAPSAAHIPVAERRRRQGGKGADASWGYMLPKADPDALRGPDGLPIPPKHLWHGYAERPERMLEIGANNVRTMTGILARSGRAPRRGDRILDFGCAGGFMLRHFREIAEDRESGGEVWGVDLSGPHIQWCMRHLMPPFRFALTSNFPSLPFPDGHFDLAYCISVFSHIGEHCDGWLAELARVILPGGRLYASVVTKESMRRYFEERPRLGFSTEMRKVFTPAQLGSDFSAAVCGNGPGLHAVYDLDTFKTKCESCFEVADIVPDAHSFQWAFVLQRPTPVCHYRPAAPEIGVVPQASRAGR